LNDVCGNTERQKEEEEESKILEKFLSGEK